MLRILALTACFIASFAGRKGGKPSGRHKVELARGRIGRFQPLSCGNGPR